MKKSLKITVSELILSAVYFLQRKNGVSAKDITKYICQKRGLKQSQMKNKVKEALNRGTQNGIFNMKRGLYKVQGDYKQKLTNLNRKVKKAASIKRSKRKLLKKKSSKEQPKSGDKQEKKISNPKLEGLPMMKRPQSNRMFEKSRSLSEASLQHGGRENSYFEPTSLAKDSDDDEFLEDEVDEDDEDNSESNDDMENFTARGIAPRKKYFSYVKVCSHPPRAKRRKITPKGKCRNKSTNKRRRKKPKTCRKPGKVRNRKSRGKDVDSDETEADEGDSEIWSESETEKSKKKSKSKRGAGTKWKGHESKQDDNENTEEGKPENKESRELNSTGKKEQIPKQHTRKYKTRKSENSSESESDEGGNEVQTNSKKEEHSEKLKKSEAELTTSSKLLDSNLKLSLSSNISVSDVKLTPTNLKFENPDSTTVLFSEKQKKQQQQHQKQQQPKSLEQDQESLNDAEYYCDCKTYRRKNRGMFSCRGNRSPLGGDFESSQRRLKPKRSHK